MRHQDKDEFANNTPNVIPQEVELKGTIRSYNEEIRAQIHEELERALGVSRTLGGDYTLSIIKGSPALYNDPGVASVDLPRFSGGKPKRQVH